MEELLLAEEVEMIPVVTRRRRSRADLMAQPDFDFFRMTRFTKDGVRELTTRLQNQLESDTNRGCPITPLQQVTIFSTVYKDPFIAQVWAILDLGCVVSLLLFYLF